MKAAGSHRGRSEKVSSLGAFGDRSLVAAGVAFTRPSGESLRLVGALIAAALALTFAALALAPGFTKAAFAADNCPNAEIRAQQQSSFLPDCRAYEIASHYPTGGVPVYEGSVVADSENGDAVLFNSIQPLPIDNVMPFGDLRGYLAQRGQDGWDTATTVFPAGPPTGALSRDGSRVIDTSRVNVDPDDQNFFAGTPGGFDLYMREPDGEFVWVSRDPRVPIGTPQVGDELGRKVLAGPGTSSMSVDGRVVVFEAMSSLDDDDTVSLGDSTGLYKWIDDGSQLGELQLIGKRPDGSVLAAQLAEYRQFGGTSETFNMAVNAVSADGSRVVFQGLGGPGQQRYLHIEGEPSRLIAKATGVPPIASPEQVTYVGGDRDLNRVFFTSTSRLTPNSGAGSSQADLYIYDVASDQVQDLTPRLDGGIDPEVDPLPDDQAQIRGVAGFSDDGKRIFFVANGQLDTDPSPEGELPDAAGNNLYMAELEEFGAPVRTEFIATLSNSDANLAIGSWQARTAYSAPDGGVFGFGATTSLTDTDIGGMQQVFVYDAGDHTLECASCPADGSSPAGAVNLTLTGNWQHLGGAGIKRWISTDGTVLFHTATRLSGRDVNSVEDVYAYREGERYLISGGSGVGRSRLIGASRDGSTILFATTDALAAGDEEPGTAKVYAAVSGGGFAAKDAPEPTCVGDDCQGEAAPPPTDSETGSSSFQGQGNPPAKPKDCTNLDRRAKKLKQQAKKFNKKARNASKGTKRAKKLKKKAKKSKRNARQAVGKARACQSGAQS